VPSAATIGLISPYPRKLLVFFSAPLFSSNNHSTTPGPHGSRCLRVNCLASGHLLNCAAPMALTVPQTNLSVLLWSCKCPIFELSLPRCMSRILGILVYLS
jgi:hypothetical protein